MYNLDDEELNEQLDERMERAIFLLLEGKTISEVATELGASRTTIYRWKKNDELFKEELNRLKRSAWEAGESKLIAARTAAIDTAIELLAHEDARIKLKAVDMILRFDASPTLGGGLVLRRGS
jgi:transposase